jgi:hypothetical protein
VGLPRTVSGVSSLSATMYWSFTPHGNGTRLSPVRLNQMRDGGVGTEVSAHVVSMSRSSENSHHTYDRQIVARRGGFRTSRPRDTTTDVGGAVVRDHSFPAPDVAGAGNGQSPPLVTEPDVAPRADD